MATTSVTTTSTPQKLFEGFPPASAAGIPGMVTPEMTADIRTPVDWDAINRALESRRTQSQASWGRVNAQREAKAKQQKAEEDKARVKAEFYKMYGPQLERSFHDRMVTNERQLFPGQVPTWTNKPNRLSSGNMDPRVTNYTPPGGWIKMPAGQLQSTLDQMWRNQTDPYYRTAMKMGG